MGWIAIVITLLIEQFRALPARNPVYFGINRRSAAPSAA